MKRYQFTGYYIVDSHAHTERAVMELDYDGVDWWPVKDADDVNPVSFQEAETFSEAGEVITAVAAVFPDERAADFVLDAAEVERLKKIDDDAIVWVPTDAA